MVEQKQLLTGRVKLLMLMLVFILPAVISWHLVFFTDYAHDGGAEHGVLIKPPRLLDNIVLNRFDDIRQDGQDHLHGKWSLLFFVEGNCDTVCKENLYRLRQIRLATGRRLSRVQRVMVIDTDVSSECRSYPGQLYVYRDQLSDNFLSRFADWNRDSGNGIFMIDPRGFLMMRYAVDADPIGIIRDLTRLLRISGDD